MKFLLNLFVKLRSLLFLISMLHSSQTFAERDRSSLSINLSLTTPLVQMQALEAWNLESASSSMIVGMIDTGIDPDHPLLKSNLWKNPKNPNIYGWDFVHHRPNPIDEHGHGTHIAGIIGANFDAQQGFGGISNHVLFMPLQYYSASQSGSVNLKNSIDALEYAIQNGARIINYSGGGPESSRQELIALKKAESQNILVICAAGNEHQNTDLSQNAYYPASYHLSNMITVAAIDSNNQLISASNWGRSTIDVGAPGSKVLSTLPQGRFGTMTGTSQATAFVSGLAALLLSEQPQLTPQQIKQIILSTVDPIESLQGKTVTGGKVNAYRALKKLKSSISFN